jgi:hypothetical protein
MQIRNGIMFFLRLRNMRWECYRVKHSLGTNVLNNTSLTNTKRCELRTIIEIKMATQPP